MQKTLKGVAFPAVCLLMLASMAIASPTCIVGNELSPGSPNGQVANSCTITLDGLTYSNFAYTIAGQTTLNTNPLSIQLAGAAVVGDEVILNFNPNLQNNGSNEGINDIHFTYEVTGTDFGASVIVSGSDASVGETNCTSGTAGNTNTCNNGSNEIWVVNAGATGPSSADSCASGGVTTGTGNSMCTWGPNQPVVWVFKDLSVGTFNSAGQSFLNADDHLTSFSEDNVVPEPLALSLTGIGLLGLGLLGRRLRRK
jgi:hypothetical protein